MIHQLHEKLAKVNISSKQERNELEAEVGRQQEMVVGLQKKLEDNLEKSEMKLSETEKENITLKVICDQYLVKKLTNDLKFCQETANLIYANNEAQRETIIVQDSVIRNLQELISCKKLGCIPGSSLVIHMSGAAWPHDALSLAETSLENNTATNLHHKT